MTGSPDGGILSVGHQDLSDVPLVINAIVGTINVSVAGRLLLRPPRANAEAVLASFVAAIGASLASRPSHAKRGGSSWIFNLAE